MTGCVFSPAERLINQYCSKCRRERSEMMCLMFNPIRPVLSSSQEYSQELERRITTSSQWRWGQHQRQRMVVWSECGEDGCDVNHYQPEEQKTLVGRWETIWLSHPRFTPLFFPPVILNHMLSAQCSFTHIGTSQLLICSYYKSGLKSL